MSPELESSRELRTGLSRRDCEPATAVREPVVVIASPVAPNASRDTAPVAAIVSPKGPPFASPRADDCEPLQIEIELPDGGRVRISGAPDPAVVAAALRAVVGR
jgi:hypothetical protein